MTENFKNKSNKKNANMSVSPSLNQGNKFDNYQNKIRKNLEKKNKKFFEGFNNLNGLNLNKNGLTKTNYECYK